MTSLRMSSTRCVLLSVGDEPWSSALDHFESFTVNFLTIFSFNCKFYVASNLFQINIIVVHVSFVMMVRVFPQHYLDITITGVNNTGTFVMDSVIVKTEVTKRKVSKNICDCLYVITVITVITNINQKNNHYK